MLSTEPVTRLSMATTSSPRSSSAWQRCEPRKPAPPVTTTRAISCGRCRGTRSRSEEHTSELQSLMRISYAVFCLKKKNYKNNLSNTNLQLNNQTAHLKSILYTNTQAHN